MDDMTRETAVEVYNRLTTALEALPEQTWVHAEGYNGSIRVQADGSIWVVNASSRFLSGSFRLWQYEDPMIELLGLIFRPTDVLDGLQWRPDEALEIVSSDQPF